MRDLGDFSQQPGRGPVPPYIRPSLITAPCFESVTVFEVTSRDVGVTLTRNKLLQARERVLPGSIKYVPYETGCS